VSLELRQLRYFVAVAEELNFTRAARRLLMSQQPLSAAIRQLETELGVSLFERTTRKVELTEAGQALLVDARELLSRADRARERARQAGTNALTLSVGVSSAAYGDLASAVLEAFRAQHPDITLQVHTYEVTAPAAGVADGSVDVSIVREPVHARHVHTLTIATEPRVFVIAADNLLATRNELSIKEACTAAWIAARRASDGCDPDRWRDFWLVNPRPDRHRPDHRRRSSHNRRMA
jgi:DNA-binding transcriptional LysR family regulator